jgi:hypothetical protein
MTISGKYFSVFSRKKYFYVLHKTQTVKLVKSARKNLKKRCLLTALG